MSEQDTSLVRAGQFNPVLLFSGEGDGLDSTIAYIREQVSGHVADVSTSEGRKEVARLARQVASSKVVLDGLGKALVAGWKEQAKKVDSERKRCRDELDALRDETRQPLTDYETAEEDAKRAQLLAAAEAHRIKMEAEEAERQARDAEIERKTRELNEREAALKAAERAEAERKERAKRDARFEVEAGDRARVKADADARMWIEANERKAQDDRYKADAENQRQAHEQIVLEESARWAAEDEENRKACIIESAYVIRDFCESSSEAFIIATAIADGKIPRVTMTFI
jgi:colicin import membrane protein